LRLAFSDEATLVVVGVRGELLGREPVDDLVSDAAVKFDPSCVFRKHLGRRGLVAVKGPPVEEIAVGTEERLNTDSATCELEDLFVCKVESLHEFVFGQDALRAPDFGNQCMDGRGRRGGGTGRVTAKS